MRKTILLGILILFAACREEWSSELDTQIENYQANAVGDYNSSHNEANRLLADLKDSFERFPQFSTTKLRHRPNLETSAKHFRVFDLEQVNKSYQLFIDDSLLTDHLVEEAREVVRGYGERSYSYFLENKIEEMLWGQLGVLYSLGTTRMYLTLRLNQVLSIMKKFDERIPLEIRERVAGHYYLLIGLAQVVDTDAIQTIKVLKSFSERGLLPGSIQKILDSFFGQIRRESKRPDQNLLLLKKQFAKEMKLLSFLYDPTKADHPLVHFSVVVGNLSWGLINSAVGGAYILTASVISPLSYIGGLFGLMEPRAFPQFKIARNQMQIYADLCGYGIMGSKMSMGIFELDYCMGHRSSSMHEGGHAKQSALLGPLYIPSAILSYLLVGGHGGFIEEWADEWHVAY